MRHINPQRSDVKVDHWVMLRNNWVVGPILFQGLPSLQVKFGDYPTGMTVVTCEDDPKSDDCRAIMFTGTLAEVLTYASQCMYVDEIITEIVQEEEGSPNDC